LGKWNIPIFIPSIIIIIIKSILIPKGLRGEISYEKGGRGGFLLFLIVSSGKKNEELMFIGNKRN
jgi:hypothetical protein